MKKRALISVYKKDGIRELAAALTAMDWEILSTGGTSQHLRDSGIPVTDVSQYTGFPECLDGRVKTLHPAIHAGLLARRNEKSHIDTLREMNFAEIDLVCVNLYPFFEKAQAGLSLEETVEFIDIGGPAMLRSAAKNYRHVTVLTDPADYAEALEELNKENGGEEFRRRLAGKVFGLTSAYDGAIARYLLDMESGAPIDAYPEFWPMPLIKKQSLRYGENSHQDAALYLNAGRPGALGRMEQLNGKELGYNNIRDLDLAWKAACAFGLPSRGLAPMGQEDLERLGLTGSGGGYSGEAAVGCVAVKHNTPCGIALGGNLLEAYQKAYACDPVSIFGGIVASTATVDAATAQQLGELFLEIVAAPDFDDDALEILKKKKNLRVIRAGLPPLGKTECIAVDGGLLVQETDRRLLEKWEVVTEAAPLPADIPDLIFGLRSAAFVKSNAIVVVRDRAAIGIGGGQTNRIWAAEQALSRGLEGAKEMKGRNGGEPPRVLASDAFFPFPDVVESAANAGIRAIVQPGGSIRDQLSIDACNRLGIAMVFTGTRHFKH